MTPIYQSIVVIGGSSGIGHEVARRARAQGARLILTGQVLAVDGGVMLRK
jgi:NADP-dependent 3-hydroxy acid dehydrogenase YdfG